MKRAPAPLPRNFYGGKALRGPHASGVLSAGETVEIARNLLGCVLWRRLGDELLAARIVETEAYLGANDRASHARGGLRSARNRSMYFAGGHAYVYFTYGMHFCMNVVTAEEGIAEAVLLRAGEPILGLETIRRNRPKAKRYTDLLSGPGKLCMGLAISREDDGLSLDGKALFITARDSAIHEDQIEVTPRIGIDNSGEAAAWPLRFLIRGNPHVSRR